MTEHPHPGRTAPLLALQRYVPPAVWVIVILVLLAIPLKIISYGYLPGDDALRHAAKAVSGKPWGDILVLGPGFHDQNFVWHFFLRQIHLWSHCDTDGLVIIAVVGLFVLVVSSPLPWLKRPEAWLITLAAVAVTSGIMQRLMLGRPFLLTMAGEMIVFSAWQFSGPSPPQWRTAAGIAVVIAVCTLVHGVWYLWALPVTAFFLARQFRWGLMLAAGWVAGVLLGALFTGHPIDSVGYAAAIARRTLTMHSIEHTLATELQPFAGDVLTLILVGGWLVLRRLGGFQARPLASNPAFWMACICWVLGFKADRFWNDWGRPALMILLTCDWQLLLQIRFAADSFKRLGLACGLAVITYMAVTNDYGDRWTYNLTEQFLSVTEHPELRGWMPDRGGIFYTADMTLFFQTFFKNPNADWRYIVGFEPAVMPDEDYKIYLNIHWNFGAPQAYEPWVGKMRPADRLVIRGDRGAPPDIPQLEWDYGVSGIWIGRRPRASAPGESPPDVPARPTVEAATPAVPSAR